MRRSTTPDSTTSPKLASLSLLPLGLFAALVWSGCSGTAVVPPTEAPLLPGADAVDLVRDTPADESPRSGATTLTGKWFGKLASFDPAEPAINSWNIDLDIEQNGPRIDAVVIMSELIPIAENIWDVHIRLDATTEGLLSNGEANLFLFNNVKAGTEPQGPVVIGNAGTDREIEYAEIILGNIVDGELTGTLIIHWRRKNDHNNAWIQTCQLKDVAPVISGNGGGPG